MQTLRMALRLLKRDWRAGELRLLAAALVIAVGSVTAVGYFTDRVERALAYQASEVLAADLVIEWSDRPADALAQAARQTGLRTARLIDFPSVVLAGDRTQLVQVKGVDEAYPLRGSLLTSPGPEGASSITAGAPPAGEVWVEARLLALLEQDMGGTLRLGDRDFRISRILVQEPDRGASLFRLAPRVLVSIDELAATGLLGPASRVEHRLLVAGEPGAVAGYRDWLKDRLPQGADLEDVRNARPEIRDALDRGGRFLKLTAVTATLLCLVAVALATRRFVQRQADASALLRCLGASRHRVNAIFTLRILMLGLIASLAGALLGLAAQAVLAKLVGHWFAGVLPPPSQWPLLSGLATGVLVLTGFALPSVLRLGNVPPLRVFRRDLGPPSARQGVYLAVAIAALAVLLIWQIGDDRLALRLIGGLAGAALLLLGVSHLLVRLLTPLRQRTTGAWRYGLASLSRNPATTSIQLTGFGLGITALLLLALVRVDLLAAWQRELPPDAPNHFLINIQPQEVDGIRSLLDSRGIAAGGPYPMSRARLLSIDGRPVEPDSYTSPRARRLAEREFNLSWSANPQPDNRIMAGRWWSPEEAETRDAFSVETGIADTLGIRLGDRLAFEIAGERIEAEVTSLRSVQWDSFNANFFVVGTPALMRGRPATYISSFHLAGDRSEVIRELVEAFPSVTPLDVTALIAQVRAIMDRGALAVEFVFGFTLIAGLVVLVAGIQTSRELRAQEAAVLRTLGLRRRGLLVSIVIEFALLGALAGIIAAAAASAVSYTLATGIFDLPWSFNGRLWLIAVAGGALGVAAAGLAATWRLSREPPLSVLRGA